MNIKYNVEKLTVLLSDLNNVLHTPVSIFDKDFGFLTSNLGCGMTDFCKIVRQTGDLKKECFRCDRDGCKACSDTGKSVTYRCHAGVWETCTPVVVENIVIGYIIFGQYRLKGRESEVESFARANGIDEVTFARYYDDLTEMSESQIESVKNILKACIEGFYLRDAVKLERSELWDRIVKYIDQNISGDLSTTALCREFLLNKKQLYSIFQENALKTVKKFILDKRMERAKKYLCETDKTVTEIAEAVGFFEYNNFIQRFKQKEGMTPLKYRKQKGGR